MPRSKEKDDRYNVVDNNGNIEISEDYKDDMLQAIVKNDLSIVSLL